MLDTNRRLTAAWAQRIVDRHVHNTTVSRVKILSTDIGTTSRIRVCVEHDGPSALPRRWFIKLPSASWRARLITTLPRLLETEVCFYQEMAHAVPVTCPPVLAARRQWGLGAALVLADVTEFGAVPGSPGDALTVAQATLVIEQLAKLHGHFRHKTIPVRAIDWLAGSVRRWEDRLGTPLAVPLMKQGLLRAGGVVPVTLHPAALDYARQRFQVMRFLADGPHTLVHHDLHPGNIFWQQARPGFLDWQLVRMGEGISDIAYFLATALSPETRRAHEMELIMHYQQILAEQGITDFDAATLLQRYRAHLIYPFEAMIMTLGVGGLMAREANLELIRRTVAAIEDHEAFTRLAGFIPGSHKRA